jgi:ABC-type phosphate transport system substrate-binding protein
MSKLATLAALLFLGLPQGKEDSPTPAPKSRPARHAVVVHVDNKTTAVGDAARTIVKKLFLKDLSEWPDGTEAKAYGRESKSEAQVAFRQEVLGMTEAELTRHWLKLKSMNGATPPKEVDSDRMVLKYVAKNPNAFGVVSLDAAKAAAGVKVLLEF